MALVIPTNDSVFSHPVYVAFDVDVDGEHQGNGHECDSFRHDDADDCAGCRVQLKHHDHVHVDDVHRGHVRGYALTLHADGDEYGVRLSVAKYLSLLMTLR